MSVDVTAGSTYFNSPCMACAVPDRGTVITVIRLWKLGVGEAWTLCAWHTNDLIDKLQRLGVRREL